MSRPHREAPVSARPSGYRVVEEVQRRQLERFALLRTRPEGLPARTRRILRAPVFGINWKLAQRIPAALPGAYWIVPGNRHLCIVSQAQTVPPAVATTCAQTSQALAHGVVSVFLAEGSAAADTPPRLIVGVAPDGVRKVRVHTRDSVATVAVTDAIFVLRDAIPAPPDLIALRRP